LTSWFRRRILPPNPLRSTPAINPPTAPRAPPLSLHPRTSSSDSLPPPTVPPHHKHSRWRRPS
jgi:hypothetical protein